MSKDLQQSILESVGLDKRLTQAKCSKETCNFRCLHFEVPDFVLEGDVGFTEVLCKTYIAPPGPGFHTKAWYLCFK